MKRIVIVANFIRDFNDGKTSRFIYLSDMLAATGRYEVELITSDFIHLRKEFRSQADIPPHNFKITLCHEPGYLSHKGPRRLYSHWRWGKNVLKHIKSQSRPDIIYCAIPSLTAAHDLARYCRKKGIKFVIDIQDLWPEAIFMLADNKLVRLVLSPMTRYIDTAYSNADVIVAVSETYGRRAEKVNVKGAPSLAVFLGNDIDRFINAPSQPRSFDGIIIGYIGTLSYSYDIGCVIESLKILNDSGKFPPIYFIIMGDGPLKERFQQHALEAGVNCQFTGMLSYEKMAANLKNCDIIVNPIIKGAAQSITNKVGDYAFAGRPVVNTQECEEYRKLIDEYQCGINCTPGDAADVAQAIARLIHDKSLRERMGENGRQLGRKKFHRHESYNLIIELLDNI